MSGRRGLLDKFIRPAYHTRVGTTIPHSHVPFFENNDIGQIKKIVTLAWRNNDAMLHRELRPASPHPGRNAVAWPSSAHLEFRAGVIGTRAGGWSPSVSATLTNLWLHHPSSNRTVARPPGSDMLLAKQKPGLCVGLLRLEPCTKHFLRAMRTVYSPATRDLAIDYMDDIGPAKWPALVVSPAWLTTRATPCSQHRRR
jgi:hypothetical protein